MTKFAAHKRATLTYLLIQHDRLTILGNFSITLESEINIRVRLLIFEVLPGAMSLLKGAMLINF